jgi:large subunit ribosomal protein L4
MTITDGAVRGAVKKEHAAPVTRTVTRRSVAGKALGKVDLEPSIFGLEPNLAVLHQVVTAQLAATRSGTQSTRTRAEVRGGGAKPFRQKGTGRARQGSSRSPSMSGGGVALGPKPRSYFQRTPKKMIRLALLSALSDRAATNRVALVDAWGWDEPKTKDAVAALRALKLKGTVLVVLADDEIVAGRSFANLPEARLATYAQLSACEVLRNDWILFSDRTLPGASAPEADSAEEEPAAKPAKAAKSTKAAKAAKAPKSEEAASAATTPDEPAATATAESEPAETDEEATDDA